MPFDWYHAKIPPFVIETFPSKRLKMYLDDMKIKATILRNLGYDREYVRMRLRGNIRWAYEMTKEPDYLNSVDNVVEEVFSKLKPQQTRGTKTT